MTNVRAEQRSCERVKINNRTIETPETYSDRVRGRVHVILQVGEPKLDKNVIDELLERPVKMPGFNRSAEVRAMSGVETPSTRSFLDIIYFKAALEAT